MLKGLRLRSEVHVLEPVWPKLVSQLCVYLRDEQNKRVYDSVMQHHFPKRRQDQI